jgi:hypothetical protein
VSLRIHTESRLALLQGEGTLTRKGWQEAGRELVAGVSAGNFWRVLSDRRRVSDISQPGIDDRLKEFLQEYAAVLGNVRWAVLRPDFSPPDPVPLTAAPAAGVELQTFSDLTEAIKWLLGVYEANEVAELKDWVNATT